MSPARVGPPSARTAVLGCLVTTLALAAGCSSPQGSATPTTNATTTTTSVPSHSSTTVDTAVTTTTVPACNGGNYTLRVLGTEGAAGTNEVTFALTNIATTACPLYGYPGIQLIGAGGSQLSTTTLRGGGLSFLSFAPASVSVAPGATAYFNMSYSDVVSGTETSCPTTTAVKVIAPNSTIQLSVAGQFTVCNSGTVNVSPVFGAGSADTETTAPPSQ